MMDYSKLSERQLEAAIEKQGSITSGYCQRFIDAGRGHETFSVIRANNDELSLAYCKELDNEQVLWKERNYRLWYHGKLSPVRPRKVK
jgi:hypothetical protein